MAKQREITKIKARPLSLKYERRPVEVQDTIISTVCVCVCVCVSAYLQGLVGAEMWPGRLPRNGNI